MSTLVSVAVAYSYPPKLRKVNFTYALASEFGDHLCRPLHGPESQTERNIVFEGPVARNVRFWYLLPVSNETNPSQKASQENI